MQETPVKKSVLTSSKLWVNTPNPHLQGRKNASLGVEVYKGNPAIVLKTGDPSEANPQMSFGKIEARMDLATFLIACEMINDIIAKPEPDKYKMACLNHIKAQGGDRSMEPTHVSDFIVGRGADGVIFMSVISIQDNNPNRRLSIPIDLPNKRYHNIIGSDGKILPPAERSNLAARALVGLWKTLVPALCDASYEPPVMMPGGNRGNYQRQGGGGGNYQRQGGGNNYQRQGGGGGGGYQQSSPKDVGADSFSDDIPF